MTETERTQTLVHTFMKYLTERNEIIDTLFCEEVDWYIQGDNRIPWIGRRNSRADVRAFFKLLWANTVPVDASIDQLLIHEVHASIAGRFSTRIISANQIFTSVFSIHLTVSGGLIKRYRLLEDSFLLSKIARETSYSNLSG